MNGATFLGLVQNAALLLAVAFIFDIATKRWRIGELPFRQVPVGLILGTIGVTIMLTPWTFTPGIIFDTRSVLIGISGLFFGSIATAVVMAMTAAFRFYQGGTGAWTGVTVILASGVIGILWRHFRRQSLANISLRELYLFGIVIHLTMLAVMFTLPWEIALRVVSKIALPVLLIYPLGTALLGTLMVKRLQRELTDKALVKSEEKYRRMVETANEGVWAMDGEYHTTFVNQRMADMLGYETEEMLGRGVDSFLFPEDLEDHSKKMTSRIQGRDPVYERRFLRKDGGALWTIVSATALQDSQGNFSGSFAMFTDITEKKIAEASLEEANDIINRSLVVAFRWKNAEGWPVDFVTDNVESLFGYKAEEFTSGKVSYAGTVHPDDLERVAKEVAEYSQEKSRLTFDHEPYRIITKDGKTKWLNDSTFIRRNEKGEITHYQGILFDITEHKRAEEVLRESEEKFRTIFDRASDGILISEPITKKFLQGNTAIRSMLGYTKEEIESLTVYDIHPPKALPHILDEFEKQVKGQKFLAEDLPLLRKDGSIIYADIGSVNITIGGIQYLVGIFRDITERKQSEAALRESETRYRTLVETSRDLIYTTDRKGFLTYVNPSLEKILGYERNELKEKSFAQIADPEFINKARDIFKRSMKGESFPVYEADLIRKDGTRLAVEFNTTTLSDPDGKPSGRYGIGRDITERRKTEAMLRQSEMRYKELFENMSSGVAVYEATENGEDFIFKQFNKAGERIENTKREEVLGKKVTMVFPGIVEMGLFSVFQRVWKTGIPEHYPVSVYQDGRISGWRENYIYKLPSGEIVAVYDDVTSRMVAEGSLRKSEEKYRSIFENAQEGIYQATLDGKFTTMNPALARMAGYGSPEEMMTEVHDIGRDLHYRPGDRAKLMEIIKKEGVVIRFETEWKKKDGSIISVILNARAVRDDQGNVLYYEVAAADVTGQKRLESQLRHAQKMEAIGTLAGGVAHDFNNLLMTMQGNASMMLQDLDPSHPHNEYLKSIERQIRSAANLTKQLLGFAKEGHYDMKPTDINEIVEKTAFMFGRTKKEIQIQRRYGEDLWPVEADADQIEQVFMNLFVNAWQAMPGGGNLFLQTQNVILDETHVKSHTTAPGRYVKISVTDTGVGMNEKTMQRIFEPFFTTKERDKGTGLGLSMVYGIIKGHKGFINVYSELSHGTTFNIYIPASGSEAVSEVSISSAIIRGTGTILLVDDESQVLKVSQRMLEHLGYKVIATQSGKEATDLYGEKKEEIDLVLLDMIMPEISGEKVFQILREINPAIKVILLSGYSLEGQSQNILEQGCNGFLQKPVTLSELSQKIHEVLNMKNEG